MNERQEAQQRWTARLSALGQEVKNARLSRVGTRSDLAEAVARPDLVDESLIRSLEDGRDSLLNPELAKPVFAAIGLSQQRYLRALGYDPW